MSFNMLARQEPEKVARKSFIHAYDSETVGFNGDEKIVSFAMETGEKGLFNNFKEFCEFLSNNMEKPQFTNAKWYAHNMGFDMIRQYNALYEYFCVPSDIEYKAKLDALRMGGSSELPKESPMYLSAVESGERNIIAINLCRNVTKQIKAKKKGDVAEFKTSRETIFSFCDSTALFGHVSLEKLAKNFGYKKLIGNIDFQAGEIPDISNPKHCEYALEDAVILRDILIDFDKAVYEAFNVHIKLTAASTAMEAWKRTIPFNGDEPLYGKNSNSHIYSRLSGAVEEFARKTYFGGYVHVGKQGLKLHKNAKYIDANSMYPFVMREYGVPMGKPVQVVEYKLGDIGLYCGWVGELSDDKVNCILTRGEKGLIAPHTIAGERFYTYLTSVDIENLLASGGSFEVDYGYKFPRYEYPFAEFITICEGLRRDFKGQVKEAVAKLMQNSLYGKFGMKPEGREYLIDSMDKSDYYYQEGFEFAPVSYQMDTRDGDDDSEFHGLSEADFMQVNASLNKSNLVRYFRDSPRSAPYMLPHWAAFVTAQARKHLHTMVRMAGYEETIYCDTDSIVLTKKGWDNALNNPLAKALIWEEDSGTPKKYGDFKVEHHCKRFRGAGAKMYAFEDENTGQVSGASKGAPKKAIKLYGETEYFELLLSGKTLPELSYESISSLDAVLSGKPRVKDSKRKASDINNSGKFDIINGLVYPKKVGNDFIFKV